MVGPVVFELDNDKIAVSPDGGDFVVKLRTNQAWKLKCPAGSEWCVPSITEGGPNMSGESIQFCTELAYDSRQATFWFEFGNGEYRSLTISQKAKAVIFPGEDNHVDVPAKGALVPIEFDATYPCRVVIPDNVKWIEQVDSRSKDSYKITLNVAENQTYSSRTTVVKIVIIGNEEVCAEYVVSQAQKDAILADDNIFEVGSEGANIRLDFQTNVDWSVVIPEDVDWIVKATDTRALADEYIQLQVLENEDYSARSAQIKVVSTKDAALFVEYTVNQAQRDAVFADENNVVTVSFKGGLVEIEYDTNVACEVVIPEDVKWIHAVTVEPTRALESMYALLNIDQNTSYSEREAEIKIVMSGNAEVYAVYTIKQDQCDAILPSEKDTYDVGSEGATIRIDFQTNVDWNVVISEEGAGWICKAPKRASLESEYVDLLVAENTSFDPRSAKIQIVSAIDNTLFVDYTVNQAQKDAIVANENNTFIVPTDGGDVVIDYATNVECEIVIPEDVTWVTNVAGVATRALEAKSATLRVAPNTSYGEREAKVKVVMVGNGELYAEYTIRQLQNDAVLEDGTIHFEVAAAGGEVELKYLTNVECEVVIAEEDMEWISKREATRGLSSESAVVAIAPNTTHDARSAVVKIVMVENSEVAVAYTITQAQMDDIVLNGDKIEAGVDGGIVALGYKANVNCKVVIPEGCEWIYVAPETRGLEERELALVIEANDTFELREETITLTGAGINREITVAQEARRIEIEKREYAVAMGDTTLEVVVDANVEYEVVVAEGCDWITVADVEGNPSKELLLLNIAENETIYERSANVVVKNGAREIELTITQSGDEGILNIDEEYIVDGVETELIVELESNFSYRVNIPEDCDWVELPAARRAKLESSTVCFKVHYNASVLDRSVDILFTDSENSFSKSIRITQRGTNLLELFDVQDNEILYVTTDGRALGIKNASFGSDILDNVYENGYGKIIFTGAVTQLGDRVFENHSTIKQIAIPGCVETIGNYAFRGCNALEDITIPQSVKHIGVGAFRGTTISKVVFAEASQLESIGKEAFSSCRSIESIVIPDGVKSLGNSAFSNCINLKSVHLPEMLESMGNNIFGSCNNLTAITIPDGVKVIPVSAFLNCTSLSNVVFGAGIEEIGASAFSGCYSLNDVIFPDTITAINDNAFYGCRAMTEVAFGEASQLKSIGNNAFAGCTSVSRVVLPAGVESIGSSAFSGCGGLLMLNANVADTTASAGIFSGSKFSSVVLGDSVKMIGNNAFKGLSSIENVAFGLGVESIGESAFNGCSSVEAIELPECVKSIGKSAFNGCSAVESVVVPASVETIGDSAFVGCVGELKLYADVVDGESATTGIFYGSKFNTVTLGNDVINIGNYAFAGCDTIEKINWGSGLERLGDSAFSGCSSLTLVSLPANTQLLGSNVFEKCTGLSTVTLPNSITSISDSAFEGCTSLYTFVSSRYIESIGKNAFKGCAELVDFELPDTLKTIGESAFDGCKGLTNVVLPLSVVEVAKSAFKSCDAIANLVLSDSMTSISESTFAGCSSIASVAIPDGVTAIADSAFEGCSSLSAVTFGADTKLAAIGSDAFNGCVVLADIAIPATVTEVGDRAFMDCAAIGELLFDQTSQLESIGDDAFNGCTAVQSVVLPATLQTIGTSAFVGCGGDLILNANVANGTSATSGIFYGAKFNNVTIGDNVTAVGDYAFAGCNTIANVTMGTNITTLGIGVFKNCAALSHVDLPASLVAIGESAFNGCTAVERVVIPESVASIGTSAFVGCGGDLTLNANIADGASASEGIFYGTKFNNVAIGGSVTALGDYAFAGCDTIANVAFGANIATLGKSVFKDCVALSRADIPASIVTIGESAFAGCSLIPAVELGEASQLTTIGKSAFNGCTAVERVVIPECVTSIGTTAFVGCGGELTMNANIADGTTAATGIFYETKFQNVVIGSNVAAVGDYAFAGCATINKVTVGSNVLSVGNSAFKDCEAMSEILFAQNSQLASIGSSAFNNCASLKSVAIPAGVATIADAAFKGCSSIESVAFDEKAAMLTSIDKEAFSGCSKIKYLVLPDTVTEIGASAFAGCTTLVTAIMGKGMVKVDNKVFYGCSKLSTVYSKALVPPTLGSEAFEGCSASLTIYVPMESVIEYQRAKAWNAFSDVIVGAK